MKRFVLALILATISIASYSQTRVIRVKSTFDFVSTSIGPSKEWEKFGGDWKSTSSQRYNYDDLVNHKDYGTKGYFQIALISFIDKGERFYALRYQIGHYGYHYPHIQVDSYEYKEYSYYYITESDIMLLVNLFENGKADIYPYAAFTLDMTGNQDKVIRYRYNKRNLQGKHCQWIYTNQENKKVVRFTLPYDARQNSNYVFQVGPYYEISASEYKNFIKSISKVLSKKGIE